jgi:hypothetical protein
MSTSIVNRDVLPRSRPDPHAYAAAAREATRQHDRAELERQWRRMMAKHAPQVRCTRCANLPAGVRCSTCVLSGLLPVLRP